MLRQHFFIDKYDWEVFIFYYVESIHKFELCDFLNSFGYTNVLDDFNLIIGVVNGGYCYTNYRDKRSILIVNITESSEQMCNTVVHELNHLESHIEEYYEIDSYSEEACYLMGELAQRVSQFLNNFII